MVVCTGGLHSPLPGRQAVILLGIAHTKVLVA
jgi:hypothetical protein